MFTTVMEALSTWAIPIVVAVVCFVAIVKKVPVYTVFTEGAKGRLFYSRNDHSLSDCHALRYRYVQSLRSYGLALFHP